MSRKLPIVLLILLLQFLFGTGELSSQHSICGTVVTPEQIARELSYPDAIQPGLLFAPAFCFEKTLSVTIHIISDSLGNYGITPATISGSIQTVNTYFAPICLSFEICRINYIENYKYNRFLKPADEAELITLYSVPNTINIYYASIVETSPGATVGGYAYFPGGPDFIIISKQSPGALLHEMGHFFGLYHTFETQFGGEFANGSNCLTAGDLICDTPADPGLGNTPSPDCQLSPYIKDINNEWYVPNIGNIMSYYSSDCRCGFTTQQYNRMANMYLNNRFYLW